MEPHNQPKYKNNYSINNVYKMVIHRKINEKTVFYYMYNIFDLSKNWIYIFKKLYNKSKNNTKDNHKIISFYKQIGKNNYIKKKNI